MTRRPEDIYNLDETGLFGKHYQIKAVQKGTSVRGRKLKKERVTILLCVNFAGDKINPLVVGKYKNPRFLRSININDLNIIYTDQKSEWMDKALFEKYIKTWNNELILQNRKVVCFLDNVCSHNIAQL